MGGEQHGHVARYRPPDQPAAVDPRARGGPRRSAAGPPRRPGRILWLDWGRATRERCHRCAGRPPFASTRTHMSRIDTVQWGAERLRVGPWRGDPTDRLRGAGRRAARRRTRPCDDCLRDAGRAGLTGRAHLGPEPDRAAGLPGPTASRSTSTSTCCATPWTCPVPARAGRHHPARPAPRPQRAPWPSTTWPSSRSGASTRPGSTTPAGPPRSSRFRVIDHGQIDAYAVTGRAGLGELPPAPGRTPRPSSATGWAPTLVLDALRWSQRHGAPLDAGQHPGAQPPARWRSTSGSGFVRQPDGLDVLELRSGRQRPDRVRAVRHGAPDWTAGRRHRGSLAAAVGAVALAASPQWPPADLPDHAPRRSGRIDHALIDQSPWVAPVGTFDLQRGRRHGARRRPDRGPHLRPHQHPGPARPGGQGPVAGPAGGERDGAGRGGEPRAPTAR